MLVVILGMLIHFFQRLCSCILVSVCDRAEEEVDERSQTNDHNEKQKQQKT